jgi:glycosyltransferase involved in cell wall biosynthesis
MNDPLVSILMPTYNSESQLLATLIAIKNQNYKNIQLVVVDKNSTDNTISLIRNHFNNTIINSQEGIGIWSAINQAITISTGEYLFSLNSDDYISPCSINDLVNLAKSSNLDCIWLPTYSAGGFNNKIKLNKSWLGMGCVTPGHSSSFFISRKFQDLIGFYDESKIYCADHYLFYKIFQKTKKFQVLNSSRTSYGVFTHGGFSSTNNYEAKVVEEFLFRIPNSFINFDDFTFCFIITPLKLIQKKFKRSLLL